MSIVLFYYIGNRDRTPWFSSYQKVFLETLRYSESEHTDQPVAVMYVGSTRDQNVIMQLSHLARPEHLPTRFRTGFYDTRSLCRVFIILHDKHDKHLQPQFVFKIGKSIAFGLIIMKIIYISN